MVFHILAAAAASPFFHIGLFTLNMLIVAFIFCYAIMNVTNDFFLTDFKCKPITLFIYMIIKCRFSGISGFFYIIYGISLSHRCDYAVAILVCGNGSRDIFVR